MKSNLHRILATAAILAIFWGCSTTRPLPSRGLSQEERRHFVIQNGYGLTAEIKNSFIEGYPLVGMSQELIFQLYSSPDRALENNKLWEYIDKRGQLITGFKFKDKIVIEILGDPRGGVPIETQGE